MANKGFNGSTAVFNGTNLGGVRSVSVTKSGAKVKVSGADATTHQYEIGIPDLDVTVEVVGGTTVAVGAKGNLAITWNDNVASPGSITNAVVASVEPKGSMDAEIVTSIKFCPST